jgi:hypothetical protein
MRKAAAVVLMSMVLACGSGDTLSMSDTQAVLATSYGSLTSTLSQQVSATTSGTTSVSANVACDSGGNATVVGHATANCPTSTTCTYDVSISATFSGCTVNGVTVDGELAVALNGSSSSFTESVDGSIHASRDGQSIGTCAIDVTVSGTQSGSVSTVSVTGSACGQNVSQ